MFRFNETTLSLFQTGNHLMVKLFDIIFLDEAFKFYEKILYNIRKAQTEHDPKFFKKLKDEIWEFRTLFQGLQYRLLAFWDKTNGKHPGYIYTWFCKEKK